MPQYKFLQSETLDEGRIARIMLNRPEARNAQNRGMLVELNDAFMQAEADDEVRAVILGGGGPRFSSGGAGGGVVILGDVVAMFSSGHDMGSKVSLEEYAPGPNQHPTRNINGGTRKGAENLMLQGGDYFFGNARGGG